MSRRSLHPACLLLALAAPLLSPSVAHAVSSAEIYTSTGYAYGRFEARIRFAPASGVVSSFFLWKDGSEIATTYWNELDFEKVGADCHVASNAIDGLPGPVNHEAPLTFAGDPCGEYHTYAYEWTPDSIAWLVDGAEVRREGEPLAASFRDNAGTQGMQFRFNVWPGNATFGGVFDPAALPVHQYIEWVQYSAYTPGAGDGGGDFTFDWREDFDAGLPSGWLLGTWGSPYGNSTHTAANVTVVDGVAVLSLTADDATGYTGTPPADTGGSANGGAPGNGGAAPTTGGAAVTGGAGGATSTGGLAPFGLDDDSDSGCGCRAASQQPSGVGLLAALAATALALGRRRSRRRLTA